MKLKLIGDVHGNHNYILNAMQTAHLYDLTIQLGDFHVGFGAEAYLPNVSSDKFKFIHGNHDNPKLCNNYKHHLGRYGVYEQDGKRIFFVAGAHSPDFGTRVPGLSMWYDEQLSPTEAELCLQLWEKECKTIDLVISHDGPPNFTMLLKGFFPDESTTTKLLWEIWKIHEPPIWVHGHWHRSFTKQIGNTKFISLNIGEELELDL